MGLGGIDAKICELRDYAREDLAPAEAGS